MRGIKVGFFRKARKDLSTRNVPVINNYLAVGVGVEPTRSS
jgi:hypothetical protein